MKVALIGFGQAGGKITEQFLEHDKRPEINSVIEHAFAINSAKADLYGISDEIEKICIGQTRVKGQGVGADNELGAEIAREDMEEILNGLSSIGSRIDAIFCIAGLGGGTGSGGLPVLVNRLKNLYELPVYSVGILPAETEGGIYNLNAAQSFQKVVEESDNTILFDNDSWRDGNESVEQGYEKMNKELIERLHLLLEGGEFREDQEVAESVVDASEIINTLDTGGISTIGYSKTKIEVEKSLLDRFRPSNKPESLDVNLFTTLCRKASRGRLTCPVDIRNNVEKALIIFAGRAERLNRKGIERSRKWIEDETGTMVVRGGDIPKNSEYVSCLVLFSGISESSRIKDLQELAIEAQDNIENNKSDPEELINNADEDVEPLF